jgi:hypothetical protein
VPTGPTPHPGALGPTVLAAPGGASLYPGIPPPPPPPPGS